MPHKEQKNSEIPLQGTVVSALQKSVSLLPVRDDDSEENAKSEKRRVERESRNAKAMIRFQALLKEHRSFADPFWELQRKTYRDLRDSRSILDKEAMETEEMEILGVLDFLIESKLIQFGRRAIVLQRAIDSHPVKEHWGVGADKTSRMMENLFLRSALHNTLITSVGILHWYEGEQKKSNLSSVRLEELNAHAKRLDINMNPIRKQIDTPTGGILEKVHIVAKSFTDRIPLARERASNERFSDTLTEKLQIMMGLQEVERELLETLEEATQNSVDAIRGPLSPAVIDAMNNIQTHDSQINGLDVIPQLIIVKARIEALWKLLVKDGVPMGVDIEVYAKAEEQRAEKADEAARMYVDDEPTNPGVSVSKGLPKPQTKKDPGEALRVPVHRTVNVDEYSEIPSRHIEDVVVSGPKEKERLTTQSAAEMLDIDLEIIQRKVAELHGSTGVEKIEKLIHDAGASALAGLDYENGDVTVQNRVQRIHSAQQLLIDEVWRRIKEKVHVQAVADALAPKKAPSAEPSKPTEKAPAWHERAFNTVADAMTDLHDGAFDGAHRLLKPAIAVLFGAGAVATGVALHEFAQNDSDEPRVSNPVAEHVPVVDAVVFDGERSVEGVDRDQDRDIGDAAPKMPVSVAAAEYESRPKTTDYVVEKGDRIWDVVSDMITDRDLKVTDEKVGYLTHLALKENAITDHGVSLKIGSVLHLNSVDRALDEMEGKTVEEAVTSAPVDSQSLRDWYTPEASVLPIHDGRYTDPGFGNYGAGSIAIPPNVEIGDVSVPHSERAYSSIPTLESPEHVMQKGEWIYKIIHTMLRENGLNWSTKRMTELKNKTLIENNLTEAQAMKIPVGTVITFADAAQDIEEMKATKRKGK